MVAGLVSTPAVTAPLAATALVPASFTACDLVAAGQFNRITVAVIGGQGIAIDIAVLVPRDPCRPGIPVASLRPPGALFVIARLVTTLAVTGASLALALPPGAALGAIVSPTLLAPPLLDGLRLDGGIGLKTFDHLTFNLAADQFLDIGQQPVLVDTDQ